MGKDRWRTMGRMRPTHTPWTDGLTTETYSACSWLSLPIAGLHLNECIKSWSLPIQNGIDSHTTYLMCHRTERLIRLHLPTHGACALLHLGARRQWNRGKGITPSIPPPTSIVVASPSSTSFLLPCLLFWINRDEESKKLSIRKERNLNWVFEVQM